MDRNFQIIDPNLFQFTQPPQPPQPHQAMSYKDEQKDNPYDMFRDCVLYHQHSHICPWCATEKKRVDTLHHIAIAILLIIIGILLWTRK